MKRIEVADKDYKRLQDLAKQLVNPDDIIDEFRAAVLNGAMATTFTKVLDHYEANNSVTPMEVKDSAGSEVLTFDATTIPNMNHTRLLKGSFGQRSPKKTTWNALVELALVAVFKSSGSAAELQQVSRANVVQGKKVVAGYRHVPEHDFSYQGVSATNAVEVIGRCARALKCPARIVFEWRLKDEALYPGKAATLIF